MNNPIALRWAELAIGVLWVAVYLSDAHAQPPMRELIPSPLIQPSLAPSLIQPSVAPSPPQALLPPPQAASGKFASPRETLKTLYFSIAAYDFRPSRIEDAIASMEVDPGTSGDDFASAARLAVELDATLREIGLPINAAPAHPAGDAVVVFDTDGFRIAFHRGADGQWRFDRQTADRIPTMYRLALARHQEFQAQRSQMREEYTDPSCTMRRFFVDCTNGDFYAAAQALDLSKQSADQRADKGPVLAQQLMYVIQRRGWLYFQEVPNNPDGPPYTWHADKEGRIVVQRVRMPEGKDAWLFNKSTVRNIEKLYETVRDWDPDPRYAELGRVVPPVTPAIAAGPKRPCSVPAHLGSPRAALEGFFRTMDEAEENDAALAEAVEYLDLEVVPPADRPAVGSKLASKLDIVLRKLAVDLAAVPDSWNAPKQILGTERGLRIELARLRDGTWRFSRATIEQIPQIAEKIAAQEQGDHKRSGHLESARDTMVSFLADTNQREDAQAAHCLDLSDIHPSVRGDVGPVLAFKLKYVIDRLGRVYPQQIPDEPEGKRYVFYTGELGRIVIARKADGGTNEKWLFTTETVERIEPMFLAVLGQPIHPSLRGGPAGDLDFRESPGVWLRTQMPPWAHLAGGGLELYQWLGLVSAVILSWLVVKISLLIFQFVSGWLLRRSGSAVTRAYLAAKLRPLTWVCTGWLFFKFPVWLDLPVDWLDAIIPVRPFLMAGLLGWLGFQMIDLLMAIYTNSELIRPHRNLSDMIVPVAMRLLKGTVFLLVLGFIIYHVGHGDSLVRFFTGLGVAGLAASLAAQDIIKSFFGTLLLIGERSFKLGDQIAVNGYEGTVEQVGFRSTRIRTGNGSLVTMPNSNITSASIDNQGPPSDVKKDSLSLMLNKDMPVDEIALLRDQLHGWLRDYPAVDAEQTTVTVHLGEEAGIELRVNFVLRANGDPARVRQEITYKLLRMVQALERRGTGPEPAGLRRGVKPFSAESIIVELCG